MKKSKKIIDLSKNKNPFMPTKKIYNLLKKNINLITKYPNSNPLEINTLLAKNFQIKESNITYTNGTLEAMDILLKQLNRKKLYIFTPTFWGMKFLANNNDYKVIEKRIDSDLEYDVKKIKDTAKIADIIYICNPNNPTLSEISKKDLLSIIRKNKDCHFIIDETVLAFDTNFEEKTLYHNVEHLDNLSVIISFSKIFNIPGMRLGILFSNDSLISKINNSKLIYSNKILEEYFLENVSQKFFLLKKQKEKIKNNFKYLINKLNKNYIEKIVVKNGSFILIKFKINTEELTNKLEQKNIIVSKMKENYPELGENWIRISAGTKKNMKKLAKYLNYYCKTI